MNMKNQTGIWIDKEQAFIIDVFGKKHTLKCIKSGIDTRERVPGESNDSSRFGNQHVNSDDHKEHRLEEQRSLFFKSIIEEIKNTETIVVFGPAEMKNELQKELVVNTFTKNKLIKVETADSMTENQVVEWVKEYYSIKR